MILPPFRLHRPASLDEAIAAAGSCPGPFDYLAGGTDLLPNYKNRLNPRRDVIALWRIDELHRLDSAAPGGLEVGGIVIGGMARLAQVATHAGIRARFGALAEAALTVATPLVRQQATLAGNLLVDNRCYYFNQSRDWRASKGYCMKADGDVCLVVPQKEICYAIYAGDTAPALLALDASLSIRGLSGERQVRARDFFQPDGIRRNVLERGDIIARISLPERAGRARSGYEKLRLRDSFDFPDAGVAAAIWMDGDRVEELQVAVGAVSMTPDLMEKATGPAKGERITAELIESVAMKVAALTQPVKNVMFPPPYRKKMVGVMTRRLLRRLAGFPPMPA